MKKKGIAIDIRTLAINSGGAKINASDLLDLWEKKAILLYDGSKGEKPILFDKGTGVYIDVSKMSPEGIDEIYNITKSNIKKVDLNEKDLNKDKPIPEEENTINKVLKEIKERNSEPYDLSGE